MLIEKVIRDYLIEMLPTVKIDTEQPSGNPESYIVFRVIDRSVTNHINSATVEFYCYGKSKIEAAELDETLRNVLPEIIHYTDLFSCRNGGGNDDKDDSLKRYRYRSYYNMTF